MSYIDRDHVSLPEIIGHARHHCSVGEGTLLHWFFPGRDMMNGLRVLTTNQTCVDMSNSSSDSNFILDDDSSSEEDEEAKEILRKFKQFKKKL
jgi:hypothetical protein